MATAKMRFLERIHRLPGGALLVFAIKQGWAAVFGGLLVGAIIFTKFVDLPWLARYDWLFLFAIVTQIGLVATKLEKPHEMLTILIFHLVGLGMEVFKTSALIGSWTYPEASIFHVGNVPLFSGFMYAAVGSYIARAWRVLHLEFVNYPNRLYTVLLAAAIYFNFFSHHFAPDIRIGLFAAVILLYRKTVVRYTSNVRRHHMPLLVGFGLVALFVWLAENIGTVTRTWLYPSQVAHWHMVSWQKIGSWFLLMIISFIMIEVLHYLHIAWDKRRVTICQS